MSKLIEYPISIFLLDRSYMKEKYEKQMSVTDAPIGIAETTETQTEYR